MLIKLRMNNPKEFISRRDKRRAAYKKQLEKNRIKNKNNVDYKKKRIEWELKNHEWRNIYKSYQRKGIKITKEQFENGELPN